MQPANDYEADLPHGLYWASWSNRKDDVLNLLERGVDPNSNAYKKEQSGYTPLHAACWNDNPEIAVLLLKWGARVDALSSVGHTPLQTAYFVGSISCMKLMISMQDHSPSVSDFQAHSGYAAMDQAEQNMIAHNTLIAEIINDAALSIPRNPLSSYPSSKQLSELQIDNWFNLGLHFDLTEEQMRCFENCLNPTQEVCCAAKKMNIDINWKDIIEGLLGVGAYKQAESVCCQQGDGHTILSVSIYYGWLDKLKLVVESQELNLEEPLHKCGDSPILLACKRGHLEMVKYLAITHQCNTQDCLLYATKNDQLTEIEFLLSKCHSNPNIKDEEGRTLLSLTSKPEVIKLLLKHGAQADNVYKAHSKHIGKLSSERPPDNPLSIFITGDGGVGKSTLLKSMLSSKGVFSIFFRRRAVTGVDEKTVGIIPHEVATKDFGKVIFFDFAGQQEFYASHCAVLENAVQTSPPLLIYCTDLQESEQKIVDSATRWMTLIQNQCCNLKGNAHVIVIGTHADKIIERNENPRANEILFSPIIKKFPRFEFIAFTPMDCRFPDSDQIREVKKQIQKSSAILRSPETVSLNAHTFYIYLLDSFKNDLAVSLEDVQQKVSNDLDEIKSKRTQNLLSFIPSTLSHLVDICDQLSKKGLILFLPNESSPKYSFIVCDRLTLLSKITGTVFAPEGFRQHCKLASSTGVVPLHKFAAQFQQYNIEMLIAFLSHLEFCFELADKEVLDHICMLQKSVSYTEHALTNETDNRYLFFPGLIRIEIPERVWENAPELLYHFGWILECSQDIHFFDSRCLQVLILRLVFAFRLAPARKISNDIPSLQRFCSVWKNGISWCNDDGIISHLELSKNGRILTLRMRSRFLQANCLAHRAKIINKVIEAVNDFCPNIIVAEAIINPDDVVNHTMLPLSDLTLCSLDNTALAIVSNREVIKSEHHPLSIQHLLYFEPYAGLDKDTLQCIHSERSTIKEEKISNSFIAHFADQVFTTRDSIRIFREILNPPKGSSVCVSSSDSLRQELIHAFEIWRNNTEGTYRCLKETLDKYSIFTGRNILSVCGEEHTACTLSMFESTSISTGQLNIEHLKEVRDATWELRAKWNHLGLQLDITSGTLATFENDHCSTDDRFVALLKFWLSRPSPPATWTTLIEAIRSAPVGYDALANKIEIMLNE